MTINLKYGFHVRSFYVRLEDDREHRSLSPPWSSSMVVRIESESSRVSLPLYNKSRLGARWL